MTCSARPKPVAVAMSGGVDSSVAALLLKKEGYDVFGIFMRNWEEKDGSCNASQDHEDALKVADKLSIPLYTVNFTEEYKERVFASFLKEYQAGFTPNPDILCNREIKFDLLLKKALSLGADMLATGHYAIKEKNQLLKAKDLSKDQSYFLYTLKKDILEKVLFPIGHLLKTEVRAIAKEAGLPVFNKKDSTGICFIGKRNFAAFLGSYIGLNPGIIETVEGEPIGQHEGLAFYTIGQRKGLRIGGRGEAWFTVSKDIKRNVLIVAQGKNHPSLFASTLTAGELSWIDQEPTLPLKCSAKIRYRQEDQGCTVEKIENGKVLVKFDVPQRAITSCQSVVFYQDNICLGGGFIS